MILLKVIEKRLKKNPPEIFEVGFSQYNDGPNYYCKWEISENGKKIYWNDAEKFHDFVPWICYLIDRFFLPWGYVLNGTITYPQRGI